MATKKISELTAVTTPTGADIFPIVQSGVTYRATRAQNASKGADIASAATTDIGAATGEYVEVTGTVTITALGTVAAGTRRIVRFTGILTLTHNATSLILPTAANITTAADDIAEFISLGSGNWICSRYSRKDGNPLAETEGAAVASAATTNIWAGDGNTVHITGTTTITSFGTALQVGRWMKVIFDGALTLTHGANLNLPGSANITTAANDFALVYADTTTLFRVLYFKASGLATVVPSTPTLQVFTATGTWTKPANVKTIKVTLVGGGGGGAAGDSAGGGAAGGGGGGGGTAIKYIDVTAISSVSVTVGGGGAGGASSNAAGVAGDTTTWGAVFSASGGGGGAASSGAAGGGGIGASGSFNIKGGGGNTPNILTNERGANGGASAFGGGGRGGDGAGEVGGAYGGGGAGGGGGTRYGGGGAGATGICIVEEYY